MARQVEIRVPIVTGSDPLGSLVRMQGMADRELAGVLEAAEQAGDDETATFALNEVVVRLDLSLDETEQGLTPAATEAVDEWVARAKRDN